ncbi:MAG TPA: hypothetical protein VFP83_05275 [Candidatus Limnocylindria bacterium]|nr:hypothetical protein [Candidatus Limnocylindria bacterium]
MRRRIVVALLGLAWLSACASPSPTPSAIGSAEPTIPESACPTIDLIAESGNPVDLTGRWRSPDGATYYVRQVASCVWITGFSADAGSPSEGGRPAFTNAFFGHLDSNFTFSGLWTEMPWGQARGGGTVTWQIVFGDVDGEESVTIGVAEQTGGTSIFLVRPNSPINVRLRLQDTDACLAAVSDDGQDYELVAEGSGWTRLGTTGLFGPNDELLRAGDPFQVSGEVGPGTGVCGDGLILFADTIEPSATP